MGNFINPASGHTVIVTHLGLLSFTLPIFLVFDIHLSAVFNVDDVIALGVAFSIDDVISLGVVFDVDRVVLCEK